MTEFENRDTGTIIAVIPDVFFSVTVRNAIRAAGLDARIMKSVSEITIGGTVEAPRLVIVDLNAVHGADEWSFITSVEQSGIPVLVFGPHRNVDGLRAAKAAGVSRVVSNGRFHGDMVGFITRYVSGEADVADANVHAGDGEGEGVE